MHIHERKYFRYVFRRVISVYQRKRESGSLGNNLTGAGTHPRMPLPCDIDFIADVEKSIKVALSPKQVEILHKLYTDHNCVDKETKYLIQEKLGIEFVSRLIHPAEEYLFLPSMGPAGYQNCKCKDVTHSAGKGSGLWCRGNCGKNMAFHPVVYRSVDSGYLGLWCEECAALEDE